MQPQGTPQYPGQGPGQPPMPYGPNNPPAGPAGMPGQTVAPSPYGTPVSGQQLPYGPAVPARPVTPATPANGPLRPQIPGQPQVPGYQMPANIANAPGAVPPNPNAPATPYDFFLDAPKPAPPSNPLPLKGKHMGQMTGANVKVDANSKKRFMLFGGLGIVGVIILFTIPALIPEDPAKQQLFNIAQTQQEIVRVCTDGFKKAKLRATRNFAITCSSGVTTNQKELLAYMSKAGFEVNTKLLGAKANGETDAKLKSAASSSTFDNTFRGIIQTQLAAYDRSLALQLSQTTGENGRAVLTRSSQANQLLVKMISDDSDKTEATPLASED